MIADRCWLLYARGLPPDIIDALGYRDARDACRDERGSVVRDVPHRRTLATRLGGVTIYRKVRIGRVKDAEREWHNLERLARLGLVVAPPAFLARCGQHTVLATLAAPGRSLFDQLHDLASRSDPAGDPVVRSVLEGDVAAAVARLHAAGLVHRDLYWHHLFAGDPLIPGRPPTWIDVERVFRPRLRTRRWVVKDLAALVASWPARRAPGLALRFLRGYSGGRLPRGWKALARAVLRKAARMRRHTPRFDPDAFAGARGG